MRHTKTFYKGRLRGRALTLAICALLCVSMLLPLSGCGETKMAQSQIFAMDTLMTLTAYGKHGEAGIAAAADVISSMDTMLDPELPTSTVYAINHALGNSVVVSGQVAQMLSTAKLVYDRSGGALDPSLYPVIKLWGFVDGKYYVPSEEEIAQVLALKCFDKMTLNSFPSSGAYSVTFPSGAEISLAAIAKGCAAENAISAMRQMGVESGIVSLGGNVQTLGLKPDGTNWNVAIQDPNNTDSYLGVISVGETAVVTSGTYQRKFTDMRGRTYHHLFNPNTGSPISNALLSVTIVCEDGTLADALSTAMFVLGESRALSYWRSYPDFEMIIVTNDNRVVCTSGLIEQITLSNPSYTLIFSE